MYKVVFFACLLAFPHSLVGMAWGGTLAYRTLILGDNPLVYYEFDETGGTTAANSAASGSSFNGTVNGAVTLNRPSFADGGAAYEFGGGYILVAPLTNSLTEWTVSAWVNYDSGKTTASNFLSNDQDGWNNDVLIGIGPEDGTTVPSGSVGVVHQGSPGSTRDFAGAPLVANEWHHIAVTGSTSAGTLSVYIDGTLQASDADLVNGVTFNGADGPGTASLKIGTARTDLTRNYDGLLDELAIFDYVLTPQQITAHATAVPVPEPAGGLMLATAGLIWFWRRSRRFLLAC